MWSPGSEILTVAEMNDIDRITIAGGMPSLTLIENAGRQVANEIAKRWSVRPTTVLCGPGNNGGDGYVVARHLQTRNWPVRVVTVGEPASDNAIFMARQWDGPTRPFHPQDPVHGDLFVDAVFGAGLSRPIDPELVQLFEDIGVADVPTVAVDVPSGIDGYRAVFTGGVQPWTAALTVTFFRPKPAHVLMPARRYCGEIKVVDIGIPVGSLFALREEQARANDHPTPVCIENSEPRLPAPPEVEAHKYRHGHALVISGPASATGAARLAARGALRVGAGLVTVVGPSDAIGVLASSLTAIMVREASPTQLATMLKDARINSVLIGPGSGVSDETRAKVVAALSSQAGCVLDADALTAFAPVPGQLFMHLREGVVLTPHEGEFERLFPGVLANSANKIEAARRAAATSGAVVLLKGPDTVIAHPNGDSAVNTNAPPFLATAGSGDVLAGIIAGCLAQHMSAFDAARAAAFLHGLAGQMAGRGLIAEDLPEMLPPILRTAENPRISGL